MNVTPRSFRDVMGAFATGVTIVTTKWEEEYYGLTVNSFASVSLNPLLILVSIARTARSHEAILRAERYAVNILADSQRALSDRFARAAEKHRFRDLLLREGRTGSPLICGTLGYLDARLRDVHEGGDHTLFVGEVVELGKIEGKQKPLIFHHGKYATVGEGLA